jgi:hypothetical protein
MGEGLGGMSCGQEVAGFIQALDSPPIPNPDMFKGPVDPVQPVSR